VPASDPATFAHELEREIDGLGRVLEGARSKSGKPSDVAETWLRAIEGATLDEVRARFEEVLEDRFDQVTALAVQHRSVVEATT